MLSSTFNLPLLATWVLVSILSFSSQTLSAPLFPNQFGAAVASNLANYGNDFKWPAPKPTTTAKTTSTAKATPTTTTSKMTSITSSSSSSSSTKTTSSITTTTSQSTSISSSSSLASASATLVAANKIRGVNLGGWFVLEQWMTPDLFNNAQSIANQTGNSNVTAVDQWTFMTAINNDTQAAQLLQNHWQTWLTESDFQQIASIGLNTVRIPIGHWTFNSSTDEPYLGGAELPYIDQAIAWAAQYNLNVMLDMHTAPNSQNGFENSGKEGNIGFKSINGTSNADRLNSALVAMVNRYVNDAQYKGIVKYVEVLNEPVCSSLGADYMTYIYQNAANAINGAISSSAITKPQVTFHDCFISPLSDWSPAVSQGGGLANVPFILDTHMYQTSTPQTFQQNINLAISNGQQIYNATQALNRQIVTGEFSLGVACTDCQFSSQEAVATANRQFFETQANAYEQGAGWIFWSWKSENNLPWSYKDALAANWIPASPTNRTEALTTSSSSSSSSIPSSTTTAVSSGSS